MVRQAINLQCMYFGFFIFGCNKDSSDLVVQLLGSLFLAVIRTVQI